jgi:hypothetical protein
MLLGLYSTRVTLTIELDREAPAEFLNVAFQAA